MASTATPPARTATATVRLEVRTAGRSTVYEVGDGGFLVGSAPGCDLRLPGVNLPPVVCLLARHPGGASLRKLAPNLPVHINGRAVGSSYLNDGDVVQVGGVELSLAIELPTPPSIPSPAASRLPADYEERLRNLEAREKQVQEASQELETDRVIWYRRREEIESECRRHTGTVEDVVRRVRQEERDLSSTRAEMEAREQAVREAQEEFARVQAELRAQADEVEREREEVRGVRREMAQLRQQLVQRYQQRKDRLLGQQQAVHKAAQRVQERKKDVDSRESRVAQEEQAQALRSAEIESLAEQVNRERALLEDQHRLLNSRQQELQRGLSERLEEIQNRERQVLEERAQLERSQKQHQADLVRLDRIQGTIDQKQRVLEQRALEVDRNFEQLQRDSRDLKEQADQLIAWQKRVEEETERLAAQKQEQDALSSSLEQRSGVLEGQQAMLATLRTRLERMREELRRQEQALADQRAMQEASETDLKGRLEEARNLRVDLDNDRQLFAEERRRFDERQKLLEQAVAQLRRTQENVEVEQEAVRQQQAQIDATSAEQAEQAGLLAARANQLEELRTRLEVDQGALRDREGTLARAEQTLGALQEQLRRRAEEVQEREKRLALAEQEAGQEAARFNAEKQTVQQQQSTARAQLEQWQEELGRQNALIQEHERDLGRREQDLQVEMARLEEAQRSLSSQRQALATERIALEVERQATQEAASRMRAEFEATRTEVAGLGRQLVELEGRAQAALDRLARSREGLREHLAEIHTYARQSRDDLDQARKQIQDEVERLRQQDLDLRVARDEHRLAVAAFRARMIEWTGQIAELKQTLAQGETRLDLRQAEVEERAQVLADTQTRLARQAETLEKQQIEVAQKRGEMDRHLLDMREWYRRKLRELAGVDIPAEEWPGSVDEASAESIPVPGSEERASGEESDLGVLQFPADVEPADEQLGKLLHSLGLMDAETITTLLDEARRQHRSLRQQLLARNYLTLYQMAFIDAGNLAALLLGPVRVIDRLRLTPREAVYRAFDPRRDSEVLLRHLAEEEMQDAVRPDEFRQRYASAASVKHPGLAEVLEVVEINDRPAVLLEWLSGLPSSDWPAVAAAPGVWFRLVSQAAQALQAVHAAGLCHGRLSESSFVLTEGGVLKLCGLGEPSWLVAPEGGEGAVSVAEESPAEDLAALARLAVNWSELVGSGRGKSKFSEDLQGVLERLGSTDPAQRYGSAADLVADLERAAPRVSGAGTAWERLLRQVAEQGKPSGLRRSA